MKLQWVRWLVNSSALIVAGVGVYMSLTRGTWWNMVGFSVIALLLYLPHWLYYGVPGFAGTFRPKLVFVAELALTTLLLLNAVGYLGLFNSYLLGFGYDTFMHFFGKLLVLVLLAIVYVSYRWHRYRLGTSQGRLLAVVAIGGIAIAFGWELFEAGLDVALSYLHPGFTAADHLSGQPGEAMDTLYDVLASGAAMLVAAFTIRRYYPALQHWHRWRDFLRDVRPRRRGSSDYVG